MQRFLADGSFLRVYLALALALLLTFGLALMGLALVDRVRVEQYREQLAEAPLQLLSWRVAALPPQERGNWLTQQSDLLNMRLSLREPDDTDLNWFERRRLDRGRVLVKVYDEDSWRLYRQLPREERILEARLSGLNERQLRGLAQLLGDWLAEVDGEARQRRLEGVTSNALPVQLRDLAPEGLDSHQLSRLRDGELVIRLLPGHWALTVHLAVPAADGSRQWLSIGPVSALEPTPISLLLLVLVIMLGVLAAIIYLIVRGVEARLARLELAAGRIASGRLDTRVKVDGGGFIGRVGMAFNAMAAQVQSLLRSQQEMIRAVSHELRTPVARIRFAMQMVEDMTDDPAVHRQLHGIDSDIEELDQLIDEILTYARLDSGLVNGTALERTRVDCRAVAERVIETLAPLHAHLRLELAPGPEVEVQADPRYLQRALQNLVANACRHAQSRVLVRLSLESRLVRLDIEDDGPGVPPGERQSIFKPFARLDDSRTRRSGGYGLGLSIVQKIMAWHGGSVVVDDSQELGGARFSLLLPRVPAGKERLPPVKPA
ncbi:ATP-binding protein [Billgrantia desiderata]|uniref:histidine kinase n=1 Tax=Billgrantia desiderata TaxID=52021 RepID=A0AAW4Z154_9GAMM|nr:ATP-binding protein [Halomonas desiderata]MCE8043836.1 HAMP domain-containing protein [Halomonas desiderata]MCE8048441.1 HAMP domain-containing protein [Halomonas desiderata]MCE8053702.1 HAMP domain-containing protein [Halomonas desiderata]NIC35918.1 HAMP domain-containing protein [Halomonas desiderata]